jgi:hypothetical protein
MIVSRTITGAEPILLADAKLWLKVDYSTDDTLINDLISSCRELIEQFTGRSVVESTVILEISAPYINEKYQLPLPTHVSVDAVTLDGVATSEYTESGTSIKSITFPTSGSYRITYKTGAMTFPGIKMVLRKLVAHNYENRNAITEMPKDVYNALMQYTI